eukprot:TRINITY_DN3610_c0_g1_i3.p1 TRINITY_DN3610_c0_g1~~TRINITY_DN3610_c0_g1_i3.p1  ORF type:complete len:141 (-),score=29.73 TRINITY_DN3610_c0_g1_i3:11-433(-)
MEKREAIFDKELSIRFDADVQLTSEEMTVNNILSEIRREELNARGGEFILSQNFRDVKPEILNGKLYNMLNSMPKGGILHSHAIGNAWDMIKLGTYKDTCYINRGSGTEDVPTGRYNALSVDVTIVFYQAVVETRKNSWR